MSTAEVRDLLLAQNPDGGWGAYAGRGTATEATALTTLALARLDTPAARAAAIRGLAWLTASQRADGAWPVSVRVSEPSWATAVGVLALDAIGREPAGARHGAEWLIRSTPRTPGLASSLLHRFAPQRLVVRQDPDLKGWSWTPDASSFVEPTCYALLALKRMRKRLSEHDVAARIDEAERMVYDRMCRHGGWNYGNSAVFDVDLWPYPDVTALALIALAEHRDREENQLSLRALRAMLRAVQSGLSLAWATLCFAAYGDDVVAWRRRLADRYRRSGFRGEIKAVALAVLAQHGDVAVFQA
jgi:hypothetical protein